MVSKLPMQYICMIPDGGIQPKYVVPIINILYTVYNVGFFVLFIMCYNISSTHLSCVYLNKTWNLNWFFLCIHVMHIKIKKALLMCFTIWMHINT
jgi:hypothetical protein